MSIETEQFDIESNTLRLEAGHRGGGMEIDLSPLGSKYEGEKMTAYQNYLGGGLLGKVGNDCTIGDWEDDPILLDLAGKLGNYFYNITNPDPDDAPWESQTFEQNQNMPISAY